MIVSNKIKNWYEHILYMKPRRISQQILQYKPTGWPDIGDLDNAGKITSEIDEAVMALP
jgi:hypothetical protein